jgi:hypothetical protein
MSKEQGRDVVLSAREYCEHVQSSDPGFEVRRSCRFQLSMELQTVDEILMRLERNRTEEERLGLVKELLELDVKTRFVVGNRMYSKFYIEAYPDQLPLENIAKFSTKIKCESDCLACYNFIHSLVKPGPRLGKL